MKYLKLVLIMFLICISTSSVSAAKQKDSQSKHNTYPAPNFTVYDENGAAVKLSDYSGKPIVLCFWASWCEPCNTCVDILNSYSKEENEVTILLVNLTDGTKETMKSAKAFLEKNKVTLPAFFDTTSQAASQYRIAVIPSTFFINSKGKLVAYAQGTISKEILKKGITMSQKK